MNPVSSAQNAAFTAALEQQWVAPINAQANVLSKCELNAADLAPCSLNQLLEMYVKVESNVSYAPSESKLRFMRATIEERCKRGERVVEGIAPEAAPFTTKFLLSSNEVQVAADFAKVLTAGPVHSTILHQLSLQDLLAVSRAFYLRLQQETDGGRKNVFPQDIGFDTLFAVIRSIVDEKAEHSHPLLNALPTESLILFDKTLGASCLGPIGMNRLRAEPHTADFSKLQPQELLNILIDSHRVPDPKGGTTLLFEHAMPAFLTPEVLRAVGASRSLDILNYSQRHTPFRISYFLAWCDLFQGELSRFPDYRLMTVLRFLLRCEEEVKMRYTSVVETIHAKATEDTQYMAATLEESLQLVLLFCKADCVDGSFIHARIDELIRGAEWKFQDPKNGLKLLWRVVIEAFRHGEDFLDKIEFVQKATQFVLADKSENSFEELSNDEFTQLVAAFGNDLGDHDELFTLFEAELSRRLSQADAREAFTFEEIRKCLKPFSARCGAPLVELLAKWLLPHAKFGFDWACCARFENLTLELLKQGINTSQLREDKKTYLHTAVTYGLLSTVRVLLEKRENVNRRDATGSTPLHYACAVALFNRNIVTLLLEAGADPSLTNKAMRVPAALLRESHQIDVFAGFEHVVAALQRQEQPAAHHYYIPAHVQEKEPINPLEAAFLLQTPDVTSAICEFLSETEAKAFFREIKKKYPLAADYCGAFLVYKAYKHNRLDTALDYTEQMSVSGLNKHNILSLALRDIHHLRRMCERGADANIAHRGISLLHLAFYECSSEKARLLLAHAADPVRADSRGARPIDKVAASKKSDAEKRAFYSELFQDFPVLAEHMKTQGLVGVAPALILPTDSQNPLEVPLILGDKALARALVQAMPREEFEKRAIELRRKYRASDCNFIEFAALELDLRHLQKRVKEAPPEKPAGVELGRLLTIAEELKIDAEVVADLDIKFIQVILKKEVVATPPTGTEAHAKFYRDVESALCHTFNAVKTEESKRHVVDRCTKLIGYCAGALQPTSIELYDQFVAGISPTFEPALFEKLGDFRKILLETLVPNDPQNTHHNQVLVYALGKKEELNLPYKEAAYDDRVLHPNAVDPVAVKAKLLELYREKVVPYVQEQLEQDGAFRGKYIDAWKRLCPASWKAEVFESITMGVAELEDKRATREEVTKFLASHDVCLGTEEDFYAAIEAARKAQFLNEVYSMEAGALSRKWVVEMLRLQGVCA